jgi:hypothetical protein
VVQLGVQVKDVPTRQGLAPQQLVVAAERLAVTVRVLAAGVGPHIETRVDEIEATHAESIGQRVAVPFPRFLRA